MASTSLPMSVVSMSNAATTLIDTFPMVDITVTKSKRANELLSAADDTADIALKCANHTTHSHNDNDSVDDSAAAAQ